LGKWGESEKGLLSLRSWLARISLTGLLQFEVIQMDLFWSGLARRAAEHTRIERRSQFSKVHEIAIKELENKNHVDAI
jgi:hypothetical protein